jgi:hypothetical protein
METKFQMYNKISKIASKYSFTTSFFGNNENSKMADFVVHVDDYCLIGLKMKTTTSKKPLTLYPFEMAIDLEQLDEYLQGHKWGQELLQEANNSVSRGFEYDECPTCGRTMFTELCGYCEGQIGVNEEAEK